MDDYKLGIDIEGVSGSITGWKRINIFSDNQSVSEKIGKVRAYTGIVEIPASQLFQTNGQPRIRVYNEKKPTTYREANIPAVKVYRRYGKRWTNIRIRRTSYQVRRSTYDWKVANSRAKRDLFRTLGYSVYKKTRNGFKYALQKRMKVADAKYKQVNKKFSTKLEQSAFLGSHPHWRSSGRTTKKRKYTTTEHEWRDSKSGKGRFTGQTRRVKTTPAKYRMMNQYEHRYTVWKTGTRTVRKTKQVKVTKTGTKYIMQCSPYGICMNVPKQYTYTDTVTRTFTTTKQYRYSVTKTNYYWAPQKFHYDDWATGKQKRQKVADAQYKTQYRFKYTERHTTIDYTYHVRKDKKVRDAQYEWQAQFTTKSSTRAMKRSQLENWRVGKAQQNIRWSLRKRTGSKTTTTNIYTDGDTVLKTYLTAKVDVVQQYVRQDGTIKSESLGSKTVHGSYQGLLTKSLIREQLKSRHGKSDNTDNKGLHCTR